MNNQEDYEVPKILEFLRQSDLSHREGISPSSQGLAYVLSHVGRLFVNEYRIIQFLPHKLILFSKSLIYNHQQREYIVMRIQPKNKLRSDREFRLKLYEKLSKTITNLPLRGTYKALILYIQNLTYSLLFPEQLRTTMAPEVHHLKYMPFFVGPVINCKPKDIDRKHAGTLLHSLVQYYIAGSGWINNENIVRQLHSSKILYDSLRAIHTVNYIIGLEMIKGGYQIMATEKLLQTTNSLVDDRTSFNRLDLILRNEDKVLVIDWKFSVQKAKDYMKGYRSKVQKYLRLVKKYYNCEVEFHLYCIHARENGFLYHFSTETTHKRIAQVEVEEGCQDEDDYIQVISNECSKPEDSRESKIDQKPLQPIKFQITDTQISELCADDYLNMHIEQQINRELAQQQILQKISEQHQEPEENSKQNVVMQEEKSNLITEETAEQSKNLPTSIVQAALEVSIQINVGDSCISVSEQLKVTETPGPQESSEQSRQITLKSVIQMLEQGVIPCSKQMAKKDSKVKIPGDAKEVVMKTKQKGNPHEENCKQQQQKGKKPVFIDLEQPILIQID